MKRGERKKWREVSVLAIEVANSINSFEEREFKTALTNKLNEIVAVVHGEQFHIDLKALRK